MSDWIAPFERLIEDIFTPANIREAEQGKLSPESWPAIQASGFLDALVPENAGGAGLSLAQIQPLWQVLGYYAVPLPVGETMIARYLLHAAGAAVPPDPIALATCGQGRPIPAAAWAKNLLCEDNGTLHLVANNIPTTLAREDGPLRRMAAALRASQIAGAAARVTEMAASYAGERNQFGKAIGKQQALQQNLAVMAEQMVACRIAAQMACGHEDLPDLALVAMAKSQTSNVAAHIAATAHATHGAIGISEEFDLQLYTRRLHEWRSADGSETYWNRILGRIRLSAQRRSIDFVRACSEASVHKPVFRDG